MRQLLPLLAWFRQGRVRPEPKITLTARSRDARDSRRTVVPQVVQGAGGVVRTACTSRLTSIAVAAVAALVVASAASAAAQSSVAEEYRIKAAFLYNFTRFVEWPPEAFPDDSAPIVMAVLGPDPFGSMLDRAVAGKQVDGRPLIVKRFDRSSDLTRCHVLYVSQRRTAEFSSRVSKRARRYMLTVGETEKFAETGGIVQFFTRQRKVRFRINPGAADQAGLKISSRLLDLAEVVGPVPNGARK